MSQIRALSSSVVQRTAAMPRGAMLALHFIFLLIAFLLAPSFAHAADVRCGTDRGPLAVYMCQLERDYPGIKLYFEFGGSGLNYSNRNMSADGTASELSASMTKIVTVFQVLEMLSFNDGQNFEKSANYVRNGWTLDTKVRIVPDIDAIPAEYARGPGFIYMGKGFASSTCMEGGGWAGIENIAHLAIYTPQNNYQYTIRDLLTMAMAASFNDAAVLLGAIVAANLAADARNPQVLTDTQKRILGVQEANVNGAGHAYWIKAFRNIQTDVARRFLGASTRTTICNPPGWSGTATYDGCRAESTPADWTIMARQAYSRTVNRLNPNRYERFFAPSSGSSFMTRKRDDTGVCKNTAVRIASTGSGLLGGTSSAGWGVGPIKLLKTGTIPPPYNMIALAQPDPVSGTQCQSDLMVAVVMSRQAMNPLTRSGILGNMFDKGRAEFTNGACGMAYDGPTAVRIASQPINSSMTARDLAVARTYVSPELSLADISAQVLPDPEDPANPGGGGGDLGEPGANVGGNTNEQQCAAEISLAEQWAAQIKSATRLGLIDNMFDSAVDEIFSAQCLGKLIKMMQDIMGTVNTITTMATSGDIMSSVVNAAASAIIRAILDQVFQSLTNMICNVTSEIIDTIDNVSRNLMCFKSPLFSVGSDPFRIPINIEDISCSGIAINPLYFSNDPNQPLGYGQIGGVHLNDVMAGDRPYFCGAGFKTVRQDAAPGWRCERDPDYRAPARDRVRARTCSYLGAYGMIREGDNRCMCQNAALEWVPCASLYQNTSSGGSSRSATPQCPSGYYLDGVTCVSNDPSNPQGLACPTGYKRDPSGRVFCIAE